MTSAITLETKFKSGNVIMNRANRTQVVKVFSASDFTIKIDYTNADDGNLVLHQVTRESENSNEYKLTLTIPNQVSHSFEADVIMTHPYAKKSKMLHLVFAADETEVPKPAKSTEKPVVNQTIREEKKEQEPQYE